MILKFIEILQRNFKHQTILIKFAKIINFQDLRHLNTFARKFLLL